MFQTFHSINIWIELGVNYYHRRLSSSLYEILGTAVNTCEQLMLVNTVESN